MGSKQGTKTEAFGSKGRRSHDSSAFYSSRLYDDVRSTDENHGIPVPETPVSSDVLDTVILAGAEHMHHLPDSSVHLMITSPPYNVGKTYDENLSLGEYLSFLEQVFREVHRVLVIGGRACINTANVGRKPYIPLNAEIAQMMISIGFSMRGEVIWDKSASVGPSTAWGSWMSASNPTLRDVHEYILVFSKGSLGRPKSGKKSTISRDNFLEHTKSIWTFKTESATRVSHPAPFPVELPFRLIQLYSFESDVILDPFMGSGTTAVAAIKSGRHFVGYEVEEEYIKVADRRIQEARRENTQLSLLDTEPHIVARERIPRSTKQIIEANAELLKEGLTDQSLSAFFQDCFQDIVNEKSLHPAWMCLDCKMGDIGMKPGNCPNCHSTQVFEVATFQGRAKAVGSVFQEACLFIFNTWFAELGVVPSSQTVYHDHCDLYLPGVAGLEAKGSPEHILGPDGKSVHFGRPGMKRTDTEKKANSNANTFKDDFKRKEDSGDPRFYVLTNAVPEDGWQEEHPLIDGIYDVTSAQCWKDLISDLEHDRKKSERSRLGRR